MTHADEPERTAVPGLRSLRLPILTIVAAALLVRAIPLGHGLPGLYVPDTHSVRNALGILETRNPVPRSNEFSSYPYLFSYVCIPLFVADYAAARLGGRVASTEEYAKDAAAHLERFHWLARWVAALAGALAAGAAVLAGARLAGTRTGIASGILAASSPLPYLLSTHERPWSLLLFFSTLALSSSLAHVRSGRLSSLCFAGVFAGLAAGCHQAGVSAIFLPAGAVFARWMEKPAAWAARLRDGAACVASFVPSFLVGNPFLVRYGPRGAVPTDLTQAVDVGIGGQGLAFRFDARHTAEALTGLVGLEGAGLLLALLGAALLLRRRNRAVAVPLVLALPVFAFFSLYTGTHARYYLLASPALWVLGGYLLADLAPRGRAGALAAGLLAAFPVILTLRTCQLLLRTDTRELSQELIARLVPQGARVAVEPYGPALPQSRESLERLAKLEADDPQHPILTRRERLALGAGRPGGFDVLPLERVVEDPAPGQYQRPSALAHRLFRGHEGLGDLLRAAGIRYVVRVDRFPSEDRQDPLVRILEQRGVLIGEVSPAAPGDVPREALLPFEPRRGISALFSVERPGPRVRLYELSP